MRIVAGRMAGRHLTSPGGKVRPTPEAVRVKIMELLADDLEGSRFLDLFAGSGAVGLEALSQGARSADFVENGAGALHALKANVTALRVRGNTRIFKWDVIPWLDAVEKGAYDIAFADPPYGSKKLDLVVARWLKVPFAPVLVLEHDLGHRIPARGKHYDFEGPTRVTVLRERS